MDIENYLLFVSASIVLCAMPGPDMAYLLGRTIAQGKKAGVLAALGINAGAYVHLTAATLGLSAIIATSSLAFAIVKWLGVAYLFYIGLLAIFQKSRFKLDAKSSDAQRGKTIFWQGFLSDALNPKVALFYLAFLPQFVNHHGSNPELQLIILGVTVNVIGIVTNIFLVYLAGEATKLLRESRRVTSWFTKLMGAVFIALGINLAKEKL